MRYYPSAGHLPDDGTPSETERTNLVKASMLGYNCWTRRINGEIAVYGVYGGYRTTEIVFISDLLGGTRECKDERKEAV